MKRMALGIGLIAATGVLLPSLAYAAAKGGGLPQLDATSFPTQIFWLVVTFAVLYLLMARVAIPRISDVLEERQERIAKDLENAQRLKDEAETVRSAYERALAGAREQASGTLREASVAVAAEIAQAEAAAAGRNAEALAAAESRIGAARTAALQNVRSAASEVAGEAVQKLIGVTVEADAVGRALDTVMEDRR